jgi:hypothetical protein
MPAVTGLPPDATVAVSLTTVPGATDETADAPEVTAREVVVAGGVPHRLMVPEMLGL